MSDHVWSRRARVVMCLVLLLALVATGWRTSDFARSSWWVNASHQAVLPDESGVARGHGFSVGIDEIAVIETLHIRDELYEPLDGYRLWHIGLRMETAESETGPCDIRVEDDRGRLHDIRNEVPSVDGYDFPSCTPPEPDDDDPPPLIQQFLVLLPNDTEPRTVRIESRTLRPLFFELPVD